MISKPFCFRHQLSSANASLSKYAVVAASLSLSVLLLLPVAHATQLAGYVGTDNGGYVYLSTSQSTVGTLIASPTTWNPAASFTASLIPGNTYYLNMEVYNIGGPGAMIGSFTLNDTVFKFSNGTQALNTDTSNWVGSFNTSLPNNVQTVPSGPPSSWVTPTGAVTPEGANGIYPWNAVPNVSSNAQWIWPSDTQSQSGGTGGTPAPCQYCWVDFSSGPITQTAQASSASVPTPETLSFLTLSLLGIGLMRKRKSLDRKTLV